MTNHILNIKHFQGHYREALQILRQIPTPTNKVSQCRLHMKLASIHFCIGDHQVKSNKTSNLFYENI